MKEVVASIRRAGIEHSKWVGYATAMIDEIKLDVKNIPLDYQSCEFGKWYAKDQWNLSKFAQFSVIASHHVKLHRLYDDMMKILKKENQLSLFKKMTGTSNKLSKADKKILMQKYQVFQQESKAILALLKALQNEVKDNKKSHLNQIAA